MSRVEIDELLDFYRKEFRVKTGMELIIAPLPINRLDIDDIISSAAEFFNIDKETILRKSNKREVVKIRQMIYALAKDNKYTMQSIARKFNKDHTTIIHALKSYYGHIKYELEYKKEFSRFEAFVMNVIYEKGEKILQEVA